MAKGKVEKPKKNATKGGSEEEFRQFYYGEAALQLRFNAGCQRVLTRVSIDLKRYIAKESPLPLAYAVKTVKNLLERLQECTDRVEASCINTMIKFPTTEEKMVIRLEAIILDTRALTVDAVACLQDMEGRMSITDKSRELDPTRPKILKHTDSLEDFIKWKKSFVSFYTACKMHSYDLRTQHIMLGAFLSPHLQSRLQESTSTAVPIFAKADMVRIQDHNGEAREACDTEAEEPDMKTFMGILQSHFVTVLPVRKINLNCFDYTQANSMKFSDFTRGLEKHMTQASLNTARFEGLAAILLIRV